MQEPWNRIKTKHTQRTQHTAHFSRLIWLFHYYLLQFFSLLLLLFRWFCIFRPLLAHRAPHQRVLCVCGASSTFACHRLCAAVCVCPCPCVGLSLSACFCCLVGLVLCVRAFACWCALKTGWMNELMSVWWNDIIAHKCICSVGVCVCEAREWDISVLSTRHGLLMRWCEDDTRIAIPPPWRTHIRGPTIQAGCVACDRFDGINSIKTAAAAACSLLAHPPKSWIFFCFALFGCGNSFHCSFCLSCFWFRLCGGDSNSAHTIRMYLFLICCRFFFLYGDRCCCRVSKANRKKNIFNIPMSNKWNWACRNRKRCLQLGSRFFFSFLLDSPFFRSVRSVGFQ